MSFDLTAEWIIQRHRLWEKHCEKLRENAFAGLTQLQIHAWLRHPLETIRRDTRDAFIPSDAFCRRAAAELQDRGILLQSLSWNGATEAVYWKLLDLGVRSIATDHPEITIAVLKNDRSPSGLRHAN